MTDFVILLADRFDVFIPILAVVFSVASALVAITGAIRAGVLKSIKIGSIEFEAQEAQNFREAFQSERAVHEGRVSGDMEASKDVPFEIKQLSSYYSQILSQSKVSFWFSLIFASIGFSVIVASGFIYKDGGGTATVIQFTSGAIIDAVAALFFVQSRNAQKSMGEFFDKLRSDRLQMESRTLCDAIANEAVRDAIKIQLSLHYSNIGGSADIAGKIATEFLAKPI